MSFHSRKRKGTKFSALIGPHHSDGGGGRRIKKFHAPESARPCAAPGRRGLKRRVGCIDWATRFGRKKRLEREYELGRALGKGRYGSVRLCRSLTTGVEYACKTLPKADDQTAHREVEIMQHLSGHPGIVTLKAVFEDAKSFHLVMELCSGGRLIDRMRKEGQSERQAAGLLKEVASAIKYCHDMGVVHRDIKPENILLTDSGKIKLADFGMAMRLTKGGRLSGVAGTPGYVAPEVLSGQYSEKVDVWGAGVLLHALLVGTLPFQGKSIEAVFEAIKTVELDFHNGLWETVSELARDLASRMLTRDVSRRVTFDQVLRHPWILLHTECPSKTVSTTPRIENSSLGHRIELQGVDPCEGSVELQTSGLKEEEDVCGFVDVLAAAIARVRISEPKRSRLSPRPIKHECSSNTKANLCAAF